MDTRSLQRWCSVCGCLVALLTALLGARAQDGPERGWMGNGSGTPPVIGAVTAVSPGNLTIRTAEGDLYKVLFSVNTRFIKDRQPAKSSEVKVGDTVLAIGVVDSKAKTVATALVAQLDPEQTKRLHEMQVNYGKTWLAGKVSTMGDAKLTIIGLDGKPASFAVDENTSFRKRRDSITLADIKIGDQVRVQGEVKNGAFLASTLNLSRSTPEDERGPRRVLDPGTGQPRVQQK